MACVPNKSNTKKALQFFIPKFQQVYKILMVQNTTHPIHKQQIYMQKKKTTEKKK